MKRDYVWKTVSLINLGGMIILLVVVIGNRQPSRAEIARLVDSKIQEKERVIIKYFSQPTVDIYKAIGKEYKEPESIEELFEMIDQIAN